MGKVVRFDITLGNPNGIYHPGDILAGQVSLKAREDIPIHGVYLWVLGQADMSWSDTPGGRRTHFDYEIYLKDCMTMWGKEPTHRCEHHRRCEHRCSRADPVILPAGGHDYPFQYKLPDKLPSSFESTDVCKGRVHYHLRARIDSPDDSIRQNKDRVFLILSNLDLNVEPRASVSVLNIIIVETVQLRKDKYLCCCCCKSGPLTCALRLDRTGYVPGEDINLDAEIQNMSRKDITASYVTMQQIIHFHAAGASKTNTCDIFRISGGKIKPGDSALFHDIIHIPPLPPSRLDCCNLIDIDYIITVGVLPSGMNTSVEVSVYITIGTTPLKHVLPPHLRGLPPSYSRYSHTTGEIEDYDAHDYQQGKTQNVYTYYKMLYKRSESEEDVT